MPRFPRPPSPSSRRCPRVGRSDRPQPPTRPSRTVSSSRTTVRAAAARRPPLEEVVADLAFPTLDNERDTWLVHDADGRAVLYGIVYCDRPGRTFFDLFVDPALDRPLRARLLATAVGEAALVRVREDAHARGLDVTIAESGMVVTDDLLPEVLTALGLAPARLWWHMSADADAIRAARAGHPGGFPRRTVRPRRRRRAAPRHGPRRRDVPAPLRLPAERVGVVRRGGPALRGLRPDRALVRRRHRDGDRGRLPDRQRLAGRAGRGFRRHARGPGASTAVGVWPARCSGRRSRSTQRRGRSSVALSVDTENATGAVGVYERVGMRAVDTIQSWERADVRRASRCLSAHARGDLRWGWRGGQTRSRILPTWSLDSIRRWASATSAIGRVRSTTSVHAALLDERPDVLADRGDDRGLLLDRARRAARSRAPPHASAAAG